MVRLLEVETREENLLAMLKEFPLSEAQAHTVRPKQAHGLGYLNPLVMVVRKDYIVLRVYQNALFDQFKTKKVPFDEFYF